MNALWLNVFMPSRLCVFIYDCLYACSLCVCVWCKCNRKLSHTQTTKRHGHQHPPTHRCCMLLSTIGSNVRTISREKKNSFAAECIIKPNIEQLHTQLNANTEFVRFHFVVCGASSIKSRVRIAHFGRKRNATH